MTVGNNDFLWLRCLRAWAAGGGPGGGVGPRLLSSVGLSAFVAVVLCGTFCGVCGRFCGWCGISVVVAASAVLRAFYNVFAVCGGAGGALRACVVPGLLRGAVTLSGAGRGCLPCPAFTGL